MKDWSSGCVSRDLNAPWLGRTPCEPTCARLVSCLPVGAVCPRCHPSPTAAVCPEEATAWKPQGNSQTPQRPLTKQETPSGEDVVNLLYVVLLLFCLLWNYLFMLKNHLTLTTMWKDCLSHCSQKFQLKILTQDQNWPLKTDWSGSRALCWWHVSYQVLLASKKSTKKSFSSSSVRLHSPPSLSTSTGGTGMGMPLWRSPSWGMSGSTIWKRSFGQSQLMYVVQHEKQNQSSDHGWVRRVSSALGPDQVQRWELCLSVYRQKCRLSCEQDIPIFVINSHSGLWSKV